MVIYFFIWENLDTFKCCGLATRVFLFEQTIFYQYATKHYGNSMVSLDYFWFLYAEVSHSFFHISGTSSSTGNGQSGSRNGQSFPPAGSEESQGLSDQPLVWWRHNQPRDLSDVVPFIPPQKYYLSQNSYSQTLIYQIVNLSFSICNGISWQSVLKK